MEGVHGLLAAAEPGGEGEALGRGDDELAIGAQDATAFAEESAQVPQVLHHLQARDRLHASRAQRERVEVRLHHRHVRVGAAHVRTCGDVVLQGDDPTGQHGRAVALPGPRVHDDLVGPHPCGNPPVGDLMA